MKRLIILRHAKTEAADGPKRDIDRVLIERGRRDAAAMAQYFVARGHGCDLVLCSTAARTRETLAIFGPIACSGVPVVYREDLYLAEMPDILAIVRSVDDAHGAVMLVGHNPGLEELALTISTVPLSIEEEARHRRMREKFATSSLAVLRFEARRWQDLRRGSGLLEDFMRPRDLDRRGD